ncbi:GNAT family N-acetyltransferase [Paenibacillus sp. Leaf72]|uniref:GNAT family N-acetyltransferase n=1 Tax=Paenibacillus sp. Leaf72 TaxID=1736234 RepID=UPI0006F9917C|nr:GNAT family N-acetyltransferase [Paenibacillus sp. Leaf72]KQO18475.1 hypothetical protein ASF12_07665 [Paenibacillus sp. Leaf72]
MKAVNATKEDIQSWLALASEVEHLFGPMVDSPKFLQALEKNIQQNRAFCVREKDGPPGARLLGGLLFSSSQAPLYKIGWLSVAREARSKGVATLLLNHILMLIPTSSELTVTTFGEDVLEGLPARRLYEKFGFVPLPLAIPAGPEGGSRQMFRLAISS